MKWVFGITLLAFAIRLYQLNAIPGEMWGDVIEHYKLVELVRSGNFFWRYSFGADGPVFTYIATFVSLFAGLSFWSLKLTTVLIGSAMVALLYVYGKLVSDNEAVARITAVLGAVSFWGITFSRQAKPYMLVPVFGLLVLILLIKKRYIWAGLVLGLGMYTQVSFWGGFVLAAYNWMTGGVALILTIPFAWSYWHRSWGVLSSQSYLYLDEKFAGPHFLHGLVFNLGSELRSFVARGDMTFRHTIPGQVLIDPLSLVFLLVGLWWLFSHYRKRKKGEQKKWLWYVLVPMGSFLVPSLLDTAHVESVPNMGRMIGILPMVMVLIAMGISVSTERLPKKVRLGVIVLVLSLIGGYNVYRYFVVYPQTLPNGNTPFGGSVATYLNATNRGEAVMMWGCCWGEAGQPEPNGIAFRLKPGIPFVYNETKSIQMAEQYHSPLTIMLKPTDNVSETLIREHFKVNSEHMIMKNNWEIARLLEVTAD